MCLVFQPVRRPLAWSSYGVCETRMLSEMVTHVSFTTGDSGGTSRGFLVTCALQPENSAPPCRKLQTVFLFVKPVIKPCMGEWDILLCLHFVYLLKHLSLIDMKKKDVFIFSKPRVLHLFSDPWGSASGQVSPRCLTFQCRWLAWLLHGTLRENRLCHLHGLLWGNRFRFETTV